MAAPSPADDSDRTREAFEILGQKVLPIVRLEALGLADDPSSVRVAVFWLHRTLCPRRRQLLAMLESKATEASVVVADAVVSAVTALPWVGATVCRALATFGLERFCDDPRAFSDELERQVAKEK